MKTLLVFAVVVVGLTSHTASAVELLKTEPGKGKLREGAVVFVDDGSCGKGKVKRILGGNQSKGVGRKSSCVAIPK